MFLFNIYTCIYNQQKRGHFSAHNAETKLNQTKQGGENRKWKQERGNTGKTGSRENRGREGNEEGEGEGRGDLKTTPVKYTLELFPNRLP